MGRIIDYQSLDYSELTGDEVMLLETDAGTRNTNLSNVIQKAIDAVNENMPEVNPDGSSTDAYTKEEADEKFALKSDLTKNEEEVSRLKEDLNDLDDRVTYLEENGTGGGEGGGGGGSSDVEIIVLYSDNAAIYSNKEMTEMIGYSEIEELLNDPDKLLILWNGNYLLRPIYYNEKGTEKAIWFNGVTSLAGKPHIYRVVINSSNQVSADEYELVQTWDLQEYAKLTDIPANTVVQINGQSIMVDAVANIPIGGENTLGVSMSHDDWGTTHSGGALIINPATQTEITNRSAVNSPDSQVTKNTRKPIVPANLDFAVKSAMCDNKGADWTVEEKANARARLGIISAEGVYF